MAVAIANKTDPHMCALRWTETTTVTRGLAFSFARSIPIRLVDSLCLIKTKYLSLIHI